MYTFLQYKTADAMTPNPVTVTPTTSLRTVEALFEQHDFNGVPVVDTDSCLLGLVTKLDLLKAFTLQPGTIVPHYDTIMEYPVTQVMTREPITVSPDLPLSRILQKLVETRNKSFPVMDGERLVGMIAREDVLKSLRHSLANAAPQDQ